MITEEQFKEIFPRSRFADEWVSAMNKFFPRFDITTNKRIAGFISQCGHESGGWRIFKENLNYSEKGLMTVFSKYFKNKNPAEYARKPEKIANLVYSNRMGNGDSDSGDGWRFRGRGPIQITGRENYTKFYEWLNRDIVLQNPDIISDNRQYGLLSAIWYWTSRDLNPIADIGDVRLLTKKINGGYNGLQDRIEKYEKCLKYLNG